MNNATLGLLVALTIITASNQFGSFVEGMENGSPTTIGEENVDTSDATIKVLTKKKVSDLKQDIADGTIGVDKEDIKAAISSKSSKEIPVDPNMNSSSEVSAFTTGMLNTNSSTLEGFTAYAPANY